MISEGKGDELIRVLEKIFTERCGMSLKIHVDYKEAVESKARRNGELKIAAGGGGDLKPSAESRRRRRAELFRAETGENRDSRNPALRKKLLRRRLPRKVASARAVSRAKAVLAAETSNRPVRQF